MTGIIITGHGQFPAGVFSAIELVGGKPESVAAVNFEAGMSADELMSSMKAAAENMKEDDILILADLIGGTPFNTAAMVKQEMTDKNIRVLAGINMPAAVEAVFSRGFASFKELVPMVISAGASGILDLDGLESDREEPAFEDGV